MAGVGRILIASTAPEFHPSEHASKALRGSSAFFTKSGASARQIKPHLSYAPISV